MQEFISIYQNTVDSTDSYSDVGDIVILVNFCWWQFWEALDRLNIVMLKFVINSFCRQHTSPTLMQSRW